MEIIKIDESNKKDFIEFCRNYTKINDDSFTPGEDFIPDEDHPSFALLNKDKKIMAACSLVLERPYRLNKKGRFMIFYSIFDEYGIYKKLLTEMLRGIDGIENLYLFTKQRPERENFSGILIELGFEIERYSFVLSREDRFAEDFHLPNDIHFKSFDDSPEDRQRYCSIINQAFSALEGHYDIFPEDLDRIFNNCEIPENGIVFLFKNDLPIGLVFSEIEKDEDEETLFIGPIAVVPEEQRKGYGTILLRKAIQTAVNMDLSQTLSVNGKNRNAISLYLKEGFVNIETVVCFNINSANMKKIIKDG